MNIQIFGSKKDNDTKKAQRFFKERGIRFQYIDLREKTLSRGEFRSVAMADRRHWDISRMCGRCGNKGGAYESRYFK